jgi:UDP-3-O-[3-hydroxymyristoyl] N-acetylglucosamine deacetylase
MIRQKTLKKTISTTGVGLHSGDTVLLTLRPAPVNTGIVFRRVDLSPVVEIPASYDYVNDTMLCTSLLYQNTRVATVEHLLSALAGLDVDNLFVDINAPEIPIMDGSAAPFVFLIQSVGVREQKAPKQYIRILKTVRIEENGKYVQLSPHRGCKISFTIDFDHPVFNAKPKTSSLTLTTASYIKEICRARTFGFLSDYEKLREADLVKGGSLDNAIVIDDYRVLNEDGLRFKGEFVSHKILDAIGDLYLLRRSVIGAFEGYRSGHSLNNRLLRALMSDETAWEYTEAPDAAVQDAWHTAVDPIIA